MMIAVAIVLAGSFTRILDAVYWMLAGENTRFDWLTFGWLINRFVAGVMAFWVYKGSGQQDLENWGFAEFFLLLLGPVFLYVQSLALASRYPDKIVDWGAHFERVRIGFFIGCALFAASNAFASHFLTVDGRTNAAAFIANTVLFILAAVFRNRYLQGTVLTLISCFMCVGVYRSLVA